MYFVILDEVGECGIGGEYVMGGVPSHGSKALGIQNGTGPAWVVSC